MLLICWINQVILPTKVTTADLVDLADCILVVVANMFFWPYFLKTAQRHFQNLMKQMVSVLENDKCICICIHRHTQGNTAYNFKGFTGPLVLQTLVWFALIKAWLGSQGDGHFLSLTMWRPRMSPCPLVVLLRLVSSASCFHRKFPTSLPPNGFSSRWSSLMVVDFSWIEKGNFLIPSRTFPSSAIKLPQNTVSAKKAVYFEYFLDL